VRRCLDDHGVGARNTAASAAPDSAERATEVKVSDTSYIRSWDDYMGAMGQKAPYQQYADQLRVQDMVRTHEQLNKLGVPYPHEEPK